MDTASSILSYGYGIVISILTTIMSISSFIFNSIHFVALQPIINIFKVLINLFVLLPINSALYLVFGTQLHLIFDKENSVFGLIHYLFDLSLILYQFLSMAFIIGLSCGVSIGAMLFLLNSMLNLRNTSFELFSFRKMAYRVLETFKVVAIWNFLWDISRFITTGTFNPKLQKVSPSQYQSEFIREQEREQQKSSIPEKEQFIKEKFNMDVDEFKKFLTSDKKQEIVPESNDSKVDIVKTSDTRSTGLQRHNSQIGQIPKHRKANPSSPISPTAKKSGAQSTSFYDDDDVYGYDLIIQQPVESSTPQRGKVGSTVDSQFSSIRDTNTLNTESLFSNNTPNSTVTTVNDNHQQQGQGLGDLGEVAAKKSASVSSRPTTSGGSRVMESLIEVIEEEESEGVANATETETEVDNDDDTDDNDDNDDDDDTDGDEYYEASAVLH